MERFRNPSKRDPKTFQKSMPKPSKIYQKIVEKPTPGGVPHRILGHGPMGYPSSWAAPNINLDVSSYLCPFFSASGSSWSRFGPQDAPKLAPKRHPINLKNHCQKCSKLKWASGPSWIPHFSIFCEFSRQLRSQNPSKTFPKPSQNDAYVEKAKESKIVLSQLPGLDF